MSTRVGIIAEGPIDYALLPPLLSRISHEKAGFQWPLEPEDMAEILYIRKRGHGRVVETVRKLVRALAHYDHALFVIVLDRRTRAAQDQVRRLISRDDRFVLGVATEEIEAWWLGDRENTLAWSELTHSLPPDCRYAEPHYKAEQDKTPKKTLDELTRVSDRFEHTYGEGNLDMAREFAEDHWRDHARLDDIAAQCPKGFGRFQREVTSGFRRAKARAGRLF